MPTDETTIKFSLLGPFEAARNGEALVLGGAKQRSLLARLLLSASEVVSRDRLIDDLWGEAPPKDAAHAIQVFVSRLRKALGRDVIATRPPGYLVRVDEEALDVTRFATLQARGREALEQGRAVAAERALAEALSLFRGPPLADFAYETWAEQEAARLEEARIACQEDLIEARLALGRHGDAIGELEALVAAQPLRERLRAQLMLALYRQGRQAEALECYQQTRALLDEQLGIEPSSELRELQRRILNQDPALALEALPGLARANLPSPATSFLGRERELEEVKALLARSDVRLLTLTGPGGTGKTRLALQAASELAPKYEDGVYWVPLANLRAPELVLPSAAQTLEAKRELRDHIGDKDLLLLLDNFEHVVEAAPGLAELLDACPRLELLVTSRESLRLSGEQAYPVPPLDTTDAVELFVTRARAHEPGFETSAALAELCARLDNLPLAIELAAARTKALSPAQILERLAKRLDLLKGARDADPRQRTLRATIEWSYDLLSPAEQQLFARLSVFAGGSTLEAAEDVCEAEVETLESLIDKSLLRYSNGRFWMLETTRQYAEEQLDASDDDGLVRRYIAWFLRLARARAEDLEGRHQSRALRELEQELDNLRRVRDLLLVTGEHEALLELGSATWRFWWTRGLLAEGRDLLNDGLTARDAPAGTQLRAIEGASFLAYLQRDLRSAESLARQQLEIARAMDDRVEVARALHALANVAFESGDTKSARTLYEEGLAQARDHSFRRYSLHALGYLALMDDDPRLACEFLSESLAVSEAEDDAAEIANTLGVLAFAVLALGDEGEAMGLLKRSLHAAGTLGSRAVVASRCLVGVAAALTRRGSTAEAVRLLAAADAITRDIGIYLGPLAQRIYGETLDTLRRELDEQSFERAQVEGRALTFDEAVAQAAHATA